MQGGLRRWGGAGQPRARCSHILQLALPPPRQACKPPQRPPDVSGTPGGRDTAPGMSGSYAKGGEAARNSTFTRAAPVRTISSCRAAS